jgi:hypothetical protein
VRNRGVGIVAMPDGEAFIVEPSPREVTICDSSGLRSPRPRALTLPLVPLGGAIVTTIVAAYAAVNALAVAWLIVAALIVRRGAA